MEGILKKVFFALVLLHLAAVAGLAYVTYHAVYDPRPIAEDLRRFTITPGSSLNSVLEQLHASGLAPLPVAMRLALSLEGGGRPLVVKAGTYALPDSAGPRDLLTQFAEGRVLLYKVTIPEGLDRWQVATLLGDTRWGDAAAFTALIETGDLVAHLDSEADSLEGYLFPETYMFPEEADAREVLTTMIRHFDERTRAMRARLADRGLTLRQWVTLASLVEKESALPRERPLIAGVFHNRLARGMLLQCDPTIIYSLKLDDRYRGKIYRSDIRYDHPYNTYVTAGLPPGPIAGPGIGSLEAALDPEETPYLYFVAKNDGSHYFSKSLHEHNRAVREFRR